MRILPLLLSCSLLFLWSSHSIAQTSPTYSLEIHSLISEYGNTLGPVVHQSIQKQWPTWEQISSSSGDYHIQIHFIEGLLAKQYTFKKLSRTQYIYQVQYFSPKYDALVKDKNGQVVLQKSYGGEKIVSTFGTNAQYTSPDKLALAWRHEREAYYKAKETELNHVNVLLTDLSNFMDGRAVPSVNDPKMKKDIEVTQESKVQNEVAIEAQGKEDITNAPNSKAENNNDPSKTEIATTQNKDDKVNAKNEDKEVIVAATTPQDKQEEAAPEETPEEREARFAEAKRAWEEMEEADEEKYKKPRVRYARLGLRLLVPNITGLHGEVVLPILNNRISIVGDFTSLSINDLISPFLDDDQSLDNVNTTYQYFSGGLNYYFRKKYARGWYLGGSYLKNLVKSSVKGESDSEEGKLELDAAALRLGLNTGRGTFLFGVEIGAGIPFDHLKGKIYTEEDGLMELEVIDEKVNIVPILNITVGVAL